MDQEVRIQLAIQNKQDLEKLTADIKAEEEALKKLRAELALGAITQSQFDAAVKPILGTLAGLSAQVEKTSASLAKLGEVPGIANRAGESLTQLGRLGTHAGVMLADMGTLPQRSLSALIFRLSMVHPALGLVAFGVEQLIRHKDDLLAFFGMEAPQRFGSEIERLHDRIKELKELGPLRLAVDNLELAEAEKRLKSLT